MDLHCARFQVLLGPRAFRAERNAGQKVMSFAENAQC